MVRLQWVAMLISIGSRESSQRNPMLNLGQALTRAAIFEVGQGAQPNCRMDPGRLLAGGIAGARGDASSR
eukprot:8420700-Pyramimonas_sp.AAC.1